ncbi:hypothetical protein N7462_007576 [Penicillium macrosclerotiorum]|uniref:uncharacterized protein n=1 Tax=Penicillium macrosclerotiorum TaxID=303699 RepID=UPI00254969CA|nr:uncharacterized protein N7462_007576 [Penicillium macrosclerotiorum]KAJ5679332.1 hypothetical protein N7462_007576 [Penicillium macrosclerotiorum]
MPDTYSACLAANTDIAFIMPICTFVTGNPNKVIEVNAIIGDSIPVQPLALDIPEIQGSLEEIAKDKCQRAAQIIDGPVIVEDSALEFIAMKKLPGPYIKYFLESLGNDGLNRLLEPYEDKSAEAVCTFAFSAGPTMEPLIFQGRLKGKIVPARGPPVFGWEPIFEHEGETLAEMPHEKKNKLSHRYKALAKFQAWLSHGQNRIVYFGDHRESQDRPLWD